MSTPMNKATLFSGAATLLVLAFVLRIESHLTGALVLMWIGLAQR